MENNDDIFAVLNTHAPSTPTWGFWDAFPAAENMTGMAEPHVDVHGTLSDVRDGQPFDSPWVSTVLNDSAEISAPYRQASNLRCICLSTSNPNINRAPSVNFSLAPRDR